MNSHQIKYHYSIKSIAYEQGVVSLLVLVLGWKGGSNALENKALGVGIRDA